MKSTESTIRRILGQDITVTCVDEIQDIYRYEIAYPDSDTYWAYGEALSEKGAFFMAEDFLRRDGFGSPYALKIAGTLRLERSYPNLTRAYDAAYKAAKETPSCHLVQVVDCARTSIGKPLRGKM